MSSSPTESTGVRLALAAISACSAAVMLYAGLRVVQKLLFPEPDPALVVWSAHSGFFWRAWTAAYVAASIGFAVYVATRRDPARLARILATSVVVAAVLIAVQGLLLP